MTMKFDDTAIDYQHFFQALLETVPWPLLIVDHALSIVRSLL